MIAKQYRTIDTAEIKSRDHHLRRMERDKFKTHYGRTFNSDKTKDIEIEGIMQKTLNGAFF
jgi:hypothetical protein